MIVGDYHTHTFYSHGEGSIEDNVRAALSKGLKEIAICDHGIGHVAYGVKRENIFKMREEVDLLNEKYPDINILLGMETNVMGYDGQIDMDPEILEVLDLVLVGYHYGIIPRNLSSIFKFYIVNNLSKFIRPLEKYMLRENTDALIKIIRKYPIRFITHPGSKAKLDIGRLAEECSRLGVALEINSSHSQLDIDSIKIAMETDVDFYINSDAHTSQRVGDFSKALLRAELAGLDMKRIKNWED